MLSNSFCTPRTRSGTEASTSSDIGDTPSRGFKRACRSAMDTDPHKPHDDVVAVEPRLRHGSTSAGLDGDDVEVGVCAAAVVAAVPAAEYRRAVEEPVGEAEADRQFEVVARRAHRRRHQLAVEPDLERLLDDQLVRLTTRATGAVDTMDEHPLGAATTH